MWILISFLALTCNSIVNSGYIYDKGLGAECLYDEDCMTRNSFCKGNKICACKIGYQYDPGSDVCFPKEVDLKCSEDYDCSALQNAKCHYGRCSCKTNYIPSKDRSYCLPTMRVSSTCEEDSQCNSIMDYSYCDPHLRQCVCEPGFLKNSYLTRCVEKKKLHSKCVTTEECETEPELKGKVECKGTGLITTCECAEGYIERNDICEKAGSSQAVLSSVTIIAAVLVKWFL